MSYYCYNYHHHHFRFRFPKWTKPCYLTFGLGLFHPTRFPVPSIFLQMS
jgi:hypothetical protein